ncbi:TOBE domain-containing protein [Nitratifractor sp.]
MNRFEAQVAEIRVHEGVSLLEFDASGRRLTMVGLEPPRGLQKGRRVVLGIKATHLILSRTTAAETSLLNALPVRCRKIVSGEILASVILAWEEQELEAIVPKPALQRLSLQEGEEIFALFPAAELSVVEAGP